MTAATAAAALERAAAQGLLISAEDGELLVEIDRDLEPAEQARLRQLKPDLLRELTAIRLDFETVSPVDLTKAGAEIYAADPRTEVLCLAWCVGPGPVQIWQPGEPPPLDLLMALADGGLVISHGSFDRIVWNAKLAPAGWPAIPLERWSDTSARARAYRVPAGLEKAAQRLELRHQKDSAGKVLIRRANVAAKGGKPISDTDKAAFLDYCRGDVEVLRELDRHLPDLAGTDRRMFELSEKMNERGLPIDLGLVERLRAVHDSENERLVACTAQLTEGVVASPTKTQKLLAWLNARYAVVPDLTRETLENWSRDDLFGGPVAEAVQLRREFAHAAGAKLKKLMDSTSSSADARARGCFAWHGAHTGRWSGRGCQPQNFPRSVAVADVDATLAALLSPGGPVDSDNGMSIKARISASLRATIAAPPGYELVVADFAQVESRVLCWLAGQNDMLEAYRQREDPYVATAKALGSDNRQFGKLLVLAAGFGGSGNMLLQKAPGFDLDLTPVEAEAAIADWRDANPAIVSFWHALHEAMLDLARGPLSSRERRGHHLAVYRKDDDTLRIKLPSGRDLIFHRPHVEPHPEFASQLVLDYWQVLGADWQRVRSWHGRATENVVQAVAYDIMAEAMLRMDGVGIDIVASIHDEIVALAPADQAESTLRAMLNIMADPPDWASDLPLAAEGYHNTRYLKPRS